MMEEDAKKDASKKGTASAVVVVQAFALTSNNLYTAAARDPEVAC